MPRKPTQARLKEYLIVAILSLVIIWLLFLIFGIYRKEEVARHAAKETDSQLQILHERESVLRGNIDELNTDRGHEATLRETYGVARPGEEVIIVVPAKEATTTPKLPWWKSALGWFGIW